MTTIKKQIFQSIILPLFCFTFGTSPAVAQVSDSITPYSYGVDLRDLIRYPTPLRNEARIIFDEFSRHSAQYFPPGIRLFPQGPGFSSESRVNSVFGIEVIKRDQNTLTVNTLYSKGKNQLFVRTYQFEVSESALKNVQLLAEQSVSDLSFEITVALAQRKLILRSIPAGIIKVYPLGVGSLDENTSEHDQIRILTPTFRNAMVERRFVEAARTYPSYYRGRPFLPVSVGRGGKTIYGFHYSITENLDRGFVSHGCMRMRDKDLYELNALVMSEKAETTPVTITFRSDENLDSPYPLNNKSYMRIKNFGTAESVQLGFDKEGLTILETHPGIPPLHRLFDFLTSTYETAP